MKMMQLIYEYKQKERIKLINELKQVPTQYHKLPFHKWISNNTPVNALKMQAHEMLLHKRLIHLSPSTLKSAYKYCDGIPNLLIWN